MRAPGRKFTRQRELALSRGAKCSRTSAVRPCGRRCTWHVAGGQRKGESGAFSSRASTTVTDPLASTRVTCSRAPAARSSSMEARTVRRPWTAVPSMKCARTSSAYSSTIARQPVPALSSAAAARNSPAWRRS